MRRIFVIRRYGENKSLQYDSVDMFLIIKDIFLDQESSCLLRKLLIIRNIPDY